MKGIQESIKTSLSGFDPGSVIFPNDFRSLGSEDAIKMSLSRLVRRGDLKRIAHGIYYKPYIDPVLGEVTPSAEAIAINLAEREKVRIRPTGIFAMHKLGLSKQVPTNLVYLTDGHPRKLKIGKVNVQFKATTPKRMALSGPISGPLILALEEMDIEHINEETEKKILALLEHEQRGNIISDLRLAKGKIYDYLMRLLKQIDDLFTYTIH